MDPSESKAAQEIEEQAGSRSFDLAAGEERSPHWSISGEYGTRQSESLSAVRCEAIIISSQIIF